MKIHIVTEDAGRQTILGRLIASLIKAPGYTVGPSPDPRADLNYFFPYLTWQRFQDWRTTKTAAWFSHQDVGRPEKERLWRACAAAVNLRLTSAQLYQRLLEPLGPTYLVTPPLDRAKFKLGKREKHDRLVIGTSGFVYPGARERTYGSGWQGNLTNTSLWRPGRAGGRRPFSRTGRTCRLFIRGWMFTFVRAALRGSATGRSKRWRVEYRSLYRAGSVSLTNSRT